MIEDIEQYLPTDMTLSDKTLEFVGRYSKTSSSSYALAWSGSTIKTAFVGTQLAATFKTNTSDYGYDYLQIYIDGERVETPLAITTTSSKYYIAKDLDFGYHYVEIVKRVDAPHTCITFEGFDYRDGVAAPPPANKARTIEFIGDSITAGWGNLASASSAAYTNSETDATKSYGYLIAQSLNADAILLGMSGGGVALNNNGTTGRIPVYWASKAYTYDTTSVDFANTKAPDVVVINAGTNDTSSGKATEDNFKTAYKALVNDVRSKYPDAFILCTIGSMTTAPYDWIEAVVNELITEQSETAENIASYKIQVSIYGDGMKGGQGHPSAACHEIMAEEITTVLKEKLGW